MGGKKFESADKIGNKNAYARRLPRRIVYYANFNVGVRGSSVNSFVVYLVQCNAVGIVIDTRSFVMNDLCYILCDMHSRVL